MRDVIQGLSVGWIFTDFSGKWISIAVFTSVLNDSVKLSTEATLSRLVNQWWLEIHLPKALTADSWNRRILRFWASWVRTVISRDGLGLQNRAVIWCTQVCAHNSFTTTITNVRQNKVQDTISTGGIANYLLKVKGESTISLRLEASWNEKEGVKCVLVSYVKPVTKGCVIALLFHLLVFSKNILQPYLIIDHARPVRKTKVMHRKQLECSA